MQHSGRRASDDPPTEEIQAARGPDRCKRVGRAAGFTAQIVLGLVSVLVVSMTGYSWAVLRGFADGVEVTDVLSPGAGGTQPMDGTRDILLVGMDSRTDAKGEPLSKEQRKLLRVDKDDGQVNTDTIILLHIPRDASKAVAISIPRDSYVDIPGYGTHKINSAYPRGKTVERRRLVDSGVTDEAEIERLSNAHGAKTLISAVEKLTGRTIDHYASINLLGFYDISQAIGGVEVCLKNPVEDINSFAKFDRGLQTVAGRDALAFVRQRHGLPRGDLDRVVRQQVFMTGMARKILSAGTLASPSKLRGLIEAIQNSVVLSKGWDIMAFAQRMSRLSRGQVEFRTIPVGSLALRTPSDGMAVEVDPDEVREFIAGLSGTGNPPSPPTEEDPANAEITVNVMNASSSDGMAAGVADRLSGKGFTKGQVGNATTRSATVVRYPPGSQDDADRVANYLRIDVAVEPDPALGSGQVTVLLGEDYPASRTDPRSHTTPAPEQGSGAAGNGGGQTPNADEPITADSVPCVN